jgi:hypothetical protein
MTNEGVIILICSILTVACFTYSESPCVQNVYYSITPSKAHFRKQMPKGEKLRHCKKKLSRLAYQKFNSLT